MKIPQIPKGGPLPKKAYIFKSDNHDKVQLKLDDHGNYVTRYGHSLSGGIDITTDKMDYIPIQYVYMLLGGQEPDVVKYLSEEQVEVVEKFSMFPEKGIWTKQKTLDVQ